MTEGGGAETRLRVLVAEDNLMNQRLICHFVRTLGCDADAVATGVEAVAAVQQRRYDLVLMDVRMPEMNGLDATRAIRTLPAEQQPHIYALTAGVAPDERQVCLDAGMEGFLAKPIERAQLAELFAQLR